MLRHSYATHLLESGTDLRYIQELLGYIIHIIDTYRDFTVGKLKAGNVEDKISYVATFEEIQENEFNLNIPRYVDTFEEEPELDIAKVQREIDALEKELATVQKEMKKYLTELMN